MTLLCSEAVPFYGLWYVSLDSTGNLLTGLIEQTQASLTIGVTGFSPCAEVLHCFRHVWRPLQAVGIDESEIVPRLRLTGLGRSDEPDQPGIDILLDAFSLDK